MKTGRSHSVARTAASARCRRSSGSTLGGRNSALLDVTVPTDTKGVRKGSKGSSPNLNLNCCYFPNWCSNCK